MSTMSLTAVPAPKAAARRANAALHGAATEQSSLPHTIPADFVARMLGIVVTSFYTRREHLEKIGFPPKLPGLNAWSTPCVLRWIETNGETYKPANADQASEGEHRINRLEQRYG